MREILRPHRGWIALALSLNLLVGLSMTFQNILPKYLIDGALLAHGLSADERKWRIITLAALYVVVGIVGRALLWNLSLRIFGRAREACLFALRSRFFRHVNQLCLHFHARHQSGEIFSYLLGTPIAQIQQYYTQLALMAPCHAVAIVFTILFLGAWDPLLTGILVGTVLTHQWALFRARRRMKMIHLDYQQVESRVSGKVADLLRGYRAVKLHAGEEATIDDFEAEAELIRDKSYRREVASHMENVKQESVLYIGYAVLCLGAAWSFLGGRITAGELTASLTSVLALQGPLQVIFQLGLLSGGARASADRIAAFLETSSSTPDPVEPGPPVPAGGDIEFRAVHFSYADERTLTDVSFRVPYGQNVALVGPSGAGKSTLVQLLLRLYDPSAGSIRIGGTNLRGCAGSDIRRRFGVVPQDPYFFAANVRDNLRMVRPEAGDEDLIAACKKANAWEFVERMPEKFDTFIGEGGSTLSGGQRQRLAIARALLLQPSYFIFDEATSALDTVSERLIRDAIADITKNHTAFFIAHRLASIEHCDRILVIEAGRLVQDGTFAELSSQDGLFRDLVSTQKLGHSPIL